MIEITYIKYKQKQTMTGSHTIVEMYDGELITPLEPLAIQPVKTAEEYRNLYAQAFAVKVPCEEYAFLKQPVEEVIQSLSNEGFALYLNHLIQLDDSTKIIQFCELFEPNKLTQIINEPIEDLNNGTILHSVMYYHTGERASDLYAMFRIKGAENQMDKCGCYPFESDNGIYYPCAGKANVWDGIGKMLGTDEKYYRKPEEFYETCDIVCILHGDIE